MGREERRMTINTICRIFFSRDEFEAQMKFETENPQYTKVGEDTIGVTYEYRTVYFTNLAEEKDNGYFD